MKCTLTLFVDTDMFDRVPAVDCYCFDRSCTMCTSPIVYFQCKRIKKLNTVQCLNHANTQNWFHPRSVVVVWSCYTGSNSCCVLSCRIKMDEMNHTELSSIYKRDPKQR